MAMRAICALRRCFSLPSPDYLLLPLSIILRLPIAPCPDFPSTRLLHFPCHAALFPLIIIILIYFTSMFYEEAPPRDDAPAAQQNEERRLSATRCATALRHASHLCHGAIAVPLRRAHYVMRELRDDER